MELRISWMRPSSEKGPIFLKGSILKGKGIMYTMISAILKMNRLESSPKNLEKCKWKIDEENFADNWT